MVCGSVGFGGLEGLEALKRKLRERSFHVIEQFAGAGRSARVRDFRTRRSLCRKIMRRDLSLVRRADAILVVADRPSFGAGVEMYIASTAGKPVVALCPRRMPSPWPIALATHLVRSEKELLRTLRLIQRHHKVRLRRHDQA